MRSQVWLMGNQPDFFSKLVKLSLLYKLAVITEPENQFGITTFALVYLQWGPRVLDPSRPSVVIYILL